MYQDIVILSVFILIYSSVAGGVERTWISGLADHEFENTYDKASNIVENIMQAEGKKMDKFLELFSKEIDECMEQFGGKLFK